MSKSISRSSVKRIVAFLFVIGFVYADIYFRFSTSAADDLDDYFFTLDSDEKNAGKIFDNHFLLNSRPSLLSAPLIFQRFFNIPLFCFAVVSDFISVVSCRSPPIRVF